MINLDKEEQAQYDKVIVKLSKEEDRKVIGEHIVNLSKCVVNLSKSNNIDLGDRKARVFVVIDYSGSMSTLYRDGTIQETLNRLIPIGLTFDDNGEIEVFLFEDGYRSFPAMTIENYKTYQADVIDRSNYSMGGTNYSPVLNAILKETDRIQTKSKGFLGLGGKEKKYNNSGDDVFIIFITDGDNYDKSETDMVIRESAKTNTFIQFIGIGHHDFKYLRKLDDLEGREFDNTGFSDISSLRGASDDTLYTAILSSFAEWIKARGQK